MNDNLIEKIRKEYEKIEKGSVKVTRGKMYTCLWMLFDFSVMEKSEISMLDHIIELIK